MRRLNKVSALLCTMFLATATAQEREQDDAEVDLEVKPQLCITDNRNPRCELSFVIVWESRTAGYYCLFNDFGDEPLRCWARDLTGRLTDERSVDESFTFWMTGEDRSNRVAEAAVEVLRLETDDRRRRRRSRHVWDIN